MRFYLTSERRYGHSIIMSNGDDALALPYEQTAEVLHKLIDDIFV